MHVGALLSDQRQRVRRAPQVGGVVESRLDLPAPIAASSTRSRRATSPGERSSTVPPSPLTRPPRGGPSQCDHPWLTARRVRLVPAPSGDPPPREAADD